MNKLMRKQNVVRISMLKLKELPVSDSLFPFLNHGPFMASLLGEKLHPAD